MPRIIFFGSSPFSVIVLERLVHSSQFIVHSVVTTPDKPVGRHFKLTPNPVKVLAQKNGIPVFDNITLLRPPLNLRGGSEGALLGLVAAYGKIIPQSVIDAFGGRIYNIHPSLLPKYRGPSPLQQQILDSSTETGVTIIQLDALIDHGPIVAQEKDTITTNDTTASLGVKLFTRGVNWFIENYLEIENWKLKIQDDFQATYTKKLTRQDGFVEFEKFKNCLEFRNSDLEIKRKLKAFADWPGVWTADPSKKRIKLIKLSPPTIQYEGQRPQLWSKPSVRS